MSKMEKDDICLSLEESQNLTHSMLRPNSDALSKRDEFIKEFRNVEITLKENGAVSFETDELVNYDRKEK